MKPKHLLILCCILAACQKSVNPGPLPVAGFTTTAETSGGIITLGTIDQYLLADTSANAVSWHWDFGNDSTSDAQNPVMSYPKSGTYTLSLTVKNKAGVSNTTTRQVKVLDRYMKQLVITGFMQYSNNVGHSLANASLYAVIRLAPDGVVYPLPTNGNQTFNAPIVFQTPSITADSTKLPFVFTIPRQLLNYADLAFPSGGLVSGGAKNIGYGLELYARDATGTYLVSSSYQTFYTSQSGAIRWPVYDLSRDIFTMQYANVQVSGDFE